MPKTSSRETETTSESPKKQRYDKPAITTEEIFESTQLLACDKPPGDPGCAPDRGLVESS